jgi:hypothetical protein
MLHRCAGNCGSVRARRYCATTSRLGTTTLCFDDDSSWALIFNSACRCSCHWEKRSWLAQRRNVARRRRSPGKEASSTGAPYSSNWNRRRHGLASLFSNTAMLANAIATAIDSDVIAPAALLKKIGSLKIVKMMQLVSKSAHHCGKVSCRRARCYWHRVSRRSRGEVSQRIAISWCDCRHRDPGARMQSPGRWYQKRGSSSSAAKRRPAEQRLITQ